MRAVVLTAAAGLTLGLLIPATPSEVRDGFATGGRLARQYRPITDCVGAAREARPDDSKARAMWGDFCVLGHKQVTAQRHRRQPARP